MTIQDYMEDLLSKVLDSSLVEGEFLWPEFFRLWFKEYGSAYFFLYKKNLNVTNIQFAELLALIKTYTTDKDNTPITNPLFMSEPEFENFVRDIVNSFQDESGKYDKSHNRLISELYSHILSRIIVVDNFFGSSAVFIPRCLQVNLPLICAHSGYIHSCGHNVFLRKVNKTSKNHFFEAMDLYLRKHHQDKRIFFTVYAHEDFTDYDRQLASELRNGLDDVKIYVEKFNMGKDFLVSILKEIKKKYNSSVEIPDPGNFKKVHKAFKGKPDVDRTRTLWLIIDYSIKDGFNRSDENYFICYEQLYKNENPFHIFDENKPAWNSHTTIPHTLGAAMINITRSCWPRGQDVTLCDPFVGSGTILMEALKYRNITIDCGDISPITPLLIEDNLDFFCKSRDELQNIKNSLTELVEYITDKGRLPLTEEEAVQGLLKDTNEGKDISSETVNRLRKMKPYKRLIFYLSLRTIIRNISAFMREKEKNQWAIAFQNETSVLIKQLNELIERRQFQQQKIETRDHTIDIFESMYSFGCCVSTERLEKFRDEGVKEMVKTRNALDLSPKSYDIIITDPPYGINTDANPENLAKLYSGFIKSMIGALRDNGELVLCLPDKIHTGRPSSFITHKEFFIKQILAIANDLGREVIIPAQSFPSPKEIYKVPYFWESDRALRRAILHFRFRSNR